MSDLARALAQAVPESRVSVAAIDRVRYASDASCYRLVPQAVVHAASVDEVRRLFVTARAQGVPLVFRTAGTSLSGQAVTDGVLVEVARHWRRLEVLDDGARVRVQPGVIGAAVNAALRPHGRRMGPDPASIDACMMGGILANNSSGMCCGVRSNAYHTLESMVMVLPDGSLLDSARDSAVFAETPLARGLVALRDAVRSNADLVARIRRKYAIKNTTGYSLNAFLDETDPLRMLARLMIGSEGTLGFIAEAVLRTIADPPLRVTALLTFATAADAVAAVSGLEAAGASAIELMDGACLRAVEGFPGIPAWIAQTGPQTAALLVEMQSADEAERAAHEARLCVTTASLPLLRPPDLAHDEAARLALWKIRKGIIPAVGARRPQGSTVIIEDVAVPVPRIGEALDGLGRLFALHGYDDSVVLGHARDGNLHFVVTPSFATTADVARYRVFLEDVVALVVSLEGSLKAEHGTGRNMAPFVEHEWGADAVAVMRRLKALVDPDGILNPGVLITDDAQAHVRHLKDSPSVSPMVDACIECGFCERRCPSRDLTMTPRQRIVALREMARGTSLGSEAEAAFAYMGEATCATDGLCATACPVQIDTGKMMKAFRGEGGALRAGEAGEMRVARMGEVARGESPSPVSSPVPGSRAALAIELSRAVARQWRWVERAARTGLRVGHAVRRLVGAERLNRCIASVERHVGARLPRWVDPMPLPARAPRAPERSFSRAGGAPDIIYLSTCTSRIMGPSAEGEPSVETLLARVCARAGVRIARLADATGTCCGMPFASKGWPQAAADVFARTVARLDAEFPDVSVPVVVDASSCARTCVEQARETQSGRRFLDAVELVADVLLPRLDLRPLPEQVAVHPPCALVKAGLDPRLLKVVSACAERAVVPDGAGCCGTAGDRGLLLPELVVSATAAEGASLRAMQPHRCVSANRTCEMGLRQATGFAFTSFLTLVDAASAHMDGASSRGWHGAEEC